MDHSTISMFTITTIYLLQLTARANRGDYDPFTLQEVGQYSFSLLGIVEFSIGNL